MKKTFKGTIESAGGGGAFITVPFDVEQTFGSKRPKVKITFDGEPYRGTLVRMGAECHMAPILKEIRKTIGKDIGDSVKITIEPDLEPRVVEVPELLQKGFRKSSKAKAAFEGLSYTHQREYAKWITEAKLEATRISRAEKAIAMLEAGTKTPASK
jgi:hypothetical protein